MAQTLKVDPNFMKGIKKLGAFDISACYSCGNCTAICPLSSSSTNFPRRMITYAQLGLQKKVLASPDMWLCNYCGECTKTCPRQAEPAEFMMAVRRFAISKYSPTPLSRLIYSSRAFTLLFMAILAIIPLSLVASFHGPVNTQFTQMFSFVPEVWIHNIGLVMGVVIFGSLLWGLARMYLLISPGIPKASSERVEGAKSPSSAKSWLKELIITVFKESLVQYRSISCESNNESKGLLRSKWFTHMTIFWGFLGLLLSTMLRFIAFPTNGKLVPVTDPIRLLGIVSGLLLVYGTSLTINNRIRKSEISTSHTNFTDWIFLVLLLLSGLTGFVLDIFDYANAPVWVYGALVTHLVVVFELLLMAPFTKFSHSFYRPFAIWISRARHYI